ncbi:MAG: PH domain-containing protein [Nitrolancea sp.]
MAVDFDNKGQLERIQGGLVDDEELFAVYDMKGGGTGFIGLTSRRLILQDEGVIRKRRSLVSIPYSHISMVASADEGGLMRKTSHLTIITSAGKEFAMEFRSSDKAERAYAFIIRHLQ